MIDIRSLLNGGLDAFGKTSSERWKLLVQAVIELQKRTFNGGGSSSSSSIGSGSSSNGSDGASHVTEAYHAKKADKAAEATHAETADKALDIANNSIFYKRFLRRDEEDTAEQTIGFLKGLWINAKELFGIDKNGNAVFSSINAKSTLRVDGNAVTKSLSSYEGITVGPEEEYGINQEGDVNANNVNAEGDVSAKENVQGNNLIAGNSLTVGGKAKINDDISAGHDIDVAGEERIDRIQSHNYSGTALSDTGFIITADNGTGSSMAVFDYLTIRKKMIVNALEIKETHFSAGDVAHTLAAAEIARTDYLYVDASGRETLLGYSQIKVPWLLRGAALLLGKESFASRRLLTHYKKVRMTLTNDDLSVCNRVRCYFLAKDGDREIENWFRVGDLVRCQTWNIVKTRRETFIPDLEDHAGNVYWWRKITDVSWNTGVQRYVAKDASGQPTENTTTDINSAYINEGGIPRIANNGTYGNPDIKHSPKTIDGNTYHWFDVAFGYDAERSGEANWCDMGSDLPAAGDKVVQFGNTTDPDRMNIFLIEVNGAGNPDAPDWKMYRGVHTFNLTNCWWGGESCRKTKWSVATGIEAYAPQFKWITEYGIARQVFVRDEVYWNKIPFERDDDWSKDISSYPDYSDDIVDANGHFVSRADGSPKNYVRKCRYYEQVSHNGSAWLCSVVESFYWRSADGRKISAKTDGAEYVRNYTYDEPSAESNNWTEQVEKGDPGAFKSTVFCRSNSTPAAPSNDKKDGYNTFDNPVPPAVSGQPTWTDGIPDGTAILWVSTAWFYSDGTHQNWTTPRQQTDTETLDVEFSPKATQPSEPYGTAANKGTASTKAQRHSQGWYDPNDTLPSGVTWSDMKWRAERKIKNGVYYGSWAITRIKGENSVRIDLDNENDSMLYTSGGKLVSDNVLSTARLFDGATDVSTSAKWTMTAVDCTMSSGNSRNIVVTGMTAATGYVNVQAVYTDKNGTVYTKTTRLTLKKLVDVDKYDLDITPNSIAYNATKDQPATSTLTIKVWKMTVDGNRVLSNPPSGYGVYVNNSKQTASSDGTYSYTTDNSAISSVQVKIAKDADLDAILDSETIPVNKAEDGVGGDTPMQAFQWNNSATKAPTLPSKGKYDNGWTATAPNRTSANTHLWMTQAVKHTAANKSVTYDDWGTAVRISGDKGDPGADSKEREWIYKGESTNSTPSTPTQTDAQKAQDDYVPDGWSDNAIATDDNSNKFVFATWRDWNKDTNRWSDFNTPILWSNWGVQGIDGDGVQYVYKLFNHELTDAERVSNIPAKPASQTQGEWIPSGWSDDPLAPTSANPYCYCSVIKKIGGSWSDTFEKLGLWSKWAKDADVWTIDSDGYWCKNGVRYVTPDGNYVLAEGKNGTGVELKGSVDVLFISQASQGQTSLEGVSAKIGECYSVKSTGHLYFYDGTSQESGIPSGWVDVGEIKGEKGDNSYVHIAYARSVSSNGSTITAVTGFTVDSNGSDYEWMGMCADNNPLDPGASGRDAGSDLANARFYKWNYLKGKDGSGYEYIYLLTKEDFKPTIDESNGQGSQSDDEFYPSVGNYQDGKIYGNSHYWNDDPPADISETWPVLWWASRKKSDGVWQAFGSVDLHNRYAKDGTSPWIADLDNEMDSVACDNDGKPVVQQAVSTNVSLFYGSQKKAFITSVNGGDTGITISFSNKTAATAKDSDTVTITFATNAVISGKKEFEITLTAKDDASIQRVLTLTVNGLKGGATYNLVPSDSFVLLNKANQYVPSVLTCTYNKFDVAKGQFVTPAGGTIKYIKDGETAENAYKQLVPGTDFTNNVTFLLYVGTTLVDRETIHIVKDGTDGKGISNVARTFAISNVGTTESETTEPAHHGSWTANSPAVTEQYPYLWAKEVVTFSDNTTTTKYYCIGSRGDNGVDAKDFEWVYIRTKTSAAPTILNDDTYVDTNGKDYTADDHLPRVIDNPNVENNGSRYQCTDDPKGVDETWKYEWESKRTKGSVQSDNSRAWNYYMGVMKLHNNFAESAFIIDLSNDNDQFGTDSDSKVIEAQTRSTSVMLYDGATRQVLNESDGVSAVLKYIDDDTAVPTSVAEVSCARDTQDTTIGYVRVTFKKDVTFAKSGLYAYITAKCAKGEKNATFTVRKLMSGQAGISPTIYQLAPSQKTFSFGRNASNILTPNSRTVEINATKTTGNTTSSATTSGDGLTYKWSFDEETATSEHSGLTLGTSITVSNTDAASHYQVWVELSSGDKETLPIVKDGINGADGDSVTMTEHWVRYAAQRSEDYTGVHPATTAFSNDFPSIPAGGYLWTWTHEKYSNGVENDAYSVSRVGIDGNGVKSSEVKYCQKQNTNTAPEDFPESDWGDYPTHLNQGWWLYTRTIIIYSNDQRAVSYSSSQIGTGSHYAGVVEYYAIGDSDTTPPTGAPAAKTYIEGETISIGQLWQQGARPNNDPAKPYLWNFEISSDSQGTRYVTSPVCIGNWSRGIAAIIELYAISNEHVLSDAVKALNWTDEQQDAAPTNEKPYQWNKTIVAYNDSKKDSSADTWDDTTCDVHYHISAVKGSDGKNGGTPEYRYQWNQSADTAPQYAASAQNPGNDWKTQAPNRPTTAGVHYLWCISAIKQANGTYGTWGNAIRLTGDTGTPGEDAKEREWIYKVSDTNPGTPASSGSGKVDGQTKPYDATLDDWVPDGWTDDPKGVTSTNKTEYASWRIYDKTTKRWGAFNYPIIWSHYGERGMDGAGMEYVFMRTVNPIAPVISDSQTGYEADEFLPTITNKDACGAESTQCSDDPKGTNDTYRFEWAAKRVKGAAAADGTRKWEKYSGEMALWANYSEDGQSTFKSHVFKRQAEQPDAPTGGSYSQPVPSGWSDGVPDGTLPVWMSTRFFTSDGKEPQQTAWTTPRQMTDTANFDVEFSSVDTPNPPSGHPNTNTQWSNTSDSTTIWMATSECHNGVWSDWQVVKVKGEKGDPGGKATGKLQWFLALGGSTRPTVPAVTIVNNVPKSTIGGQTVSWNEGSDPSWSKTKKYLYEIDYYTLSDGTGYWSEPFFLSEWAEQGPEGEAAWAFSANPANVIITQSLDDNKLTSFSSATVSFAAKKGRKSATITSIAIPTGQQALSNEFNAAIGTGDDSKKVIVSSPKTHGTPEEYYTEGSFKVVVNAQASDGSTSSQEVTVLCYANLLGTWKREVEAGVETVTAQLTQYLKDDDGNIITSKSLRNDINDATQDLSELSQTVTTQGQVIQNQNTRLSTAEQNSAKIERDTTELVKNIDNTAFEDIDGTQVALSAGEYIVQLKVDTEDLPTGNYVFDFAGFHYEGGEQFIEHRITVDNSGTYTITLHDDIQSGTGMATMLYIGRVFNVSSEIKQKAGNIMLQVNDKVSQSDFNIFSNSIQSSVKNISPSKNLLKGSLSAKGWLSSPSDVVASGVPYTSAKLDDDGYIVTNGYDQYLAQKLTLSGGKTYALSFYSKKTTAITVTVWVVDYPTMKQTFTVAATGASDRKTAKIEVSPYLGGYMGISINATNIKHPQLEEGDTATDFIADSTEISSDIIQIADNIQLFVTQGLSNTGIDITNGTIELQANKVTFCDANGGNTDKIWIDPTNGTLHAVDGHFSGEITATSGSITGQMNIASGGSIIVGKEDSYRIKIAQSSNRGYITMLDGEGDNIILINYNTGKNAGQIKVSEADAQHERYTFIDPYSMESVYNYKNASGQWNGDHSHITTQVGRRMAETEYDDLYVSGGFVARRHIKIGVGTTESGSSEQSVVNLRAYNDNQESAWPVCSLDPTGANWMDKGHVHVMTMGELKVLLENPNSIYSSHLANYAVMLTRINGN